MEREAFRLRMQQYKLARENNPLLKYWDWKKYADGGEVRDNTYVAPVYKELVFIPATGALKIKNDYQYKYGSKSPYKGGELEIVSPEFDILTGITTLKPIVTKAIRDRARMAVYNNVAPGSYKKSYIAGASKRHEVFNAAKDFLKPGKLEENPKWRKSFQDSSWWEGFGYGNDAKIAEEIREESWKRYLGIKHTPKYYVDNLDGTVSYNLKNIPLKHQLNFVDEVPRGGKVVTGDYIGTAGGNVSASSTIEDGYDLVTLKDVWDLLPILDANRAAILPSKLRDKISHIEVQPDGYKKIVYNNWVPKWFKNFEVSDVIGKGPFTNKTTIKAVLLKNKDLFTKRILSDEEAANKLIQHDLDIFEPDMYNSVLEAKEAFQSILNSKLKRLKSLSKEEYDRIKTEIIYKSLDQLLKEYGPYIRPRNKYADGGEVRDNTYVAPVYKELVFIPATGALKIKNDYQYKYGSKSPYKGGELEIVSPEFDILTGAKAAYDTTVGLINNLSRTNRTRKIVNSFKKNLKTSDKLDVLKDNPEFGQIGTPFDYSNYIDDIFKDSLLKGIYYHGGPKGIEKFRAPKDPEFVLNKAINSGTKEQGIYFTGDKGLANYYKSSNKNGKVYKVKLNSLNPYYTNDWFAVRIRSALDKDYVYPGSITDRVRSGILKDHDAVVWHGRLGENIVFDPDQIHILGSKKDMQLFNDYIKNKHSYKNGGVIDEDPPQNTSERPITNFDPKGDPYNPTYGYNPGAGYVRSVFDLYDAPVIGDALSIYDATQALKNKDWLGAGLAALTVVPFIPTVSNYKKSLNQQLNRITGITPDISKLLKQSDWNDLRNRSIERLYDPEVRARAAKIKSDYNVDLQSTYDKIINLYENDYFSLPEAEIVLLLDAKAMLDLLEEAARRYKQYGIKPTLKDFRIKVDNAVTPNLEITNHEINHFNLYIHQDNPSWNKSELNKITKQFDGKLRDKNPIDPLNTSYFMNWMEQNAYGINMLDRLKELNIKPTKQNILKYLKSLPDTDSIKKAALQFKNLDDYIKWLNTMPLADNGNINETENYNFA